jgi:hypothetical protein
MWKTIARIKAVVDWAGTVYTVLGFFGGLAVVSSIVVTVGGAIWALLTGVSTPIVIMAAYCTLAGGIYLALAPLAYQALSRIAEVVTPELVSAIEKTPDIDVWKHKEEFWLYEAACLLADTSPSVKRVHGTNADAWWTMLATALKRQEIMRIPSTLDDTNSTFNSEYVPHDFTVISKEELVKFALKRKQRPRFLLIDND